MAELTEAILKITELLQKLAQPAPAPVNAEQILESLATNIGEFSFDPENGVTFDKWFQRYEDMFAKDAARLEDDAKVRLLLRKLDTLSHSRYCNYILPKLPKDVTFDVTVATLKKIFGAQTSIFNKRYQCLQLEKSDADDIISYGGKVNRACEDFEFKNLKIDQFKCLIFIAGLKSPRYADIRARLLSRIEAETPENPVTLQTLIDEYLRLVNLKVDTTLIERPTSSPNVVQSVQETKQRPSRKDNKEPPYPCWKCGQMHFIRNCPFVDHMCQVCKRVGHKEGYCKCASRTSSSSSSSSSDSTVSNSTSVKQPKPTKQGKARCKIISVVNSVVSRPSSLNHPRSAEEQIGQQQATKQVLANRTEVQQTFKQGDTVFARVRRGKTREWIPATIIEPVERGKYNVFLTECRRLVRRPARKLRIHVPANCPSEARSPLSILLEEFGLVQDPDSPTLKLNKSFEASDQSSAAGYRTSPAALPLPSNPNWMA